MMLGFASGVMIAASFWSLLAPAIELAESGPLPAWFVAASGFLAGALFLWLADRLMPHIHFSSRDGEAEGIHSHLKRSILLVLSITIHNIPEGLAVGVAFGALSGTITTNALLPAVAVALGIGIQNFPEGAAVSIPLRREGLSRTRSFFYGQASGIVEPIAAVLGAFLVTLARPILPYALAFAAGAMIFVVVEELIPTAQEGDHESTDLATIGAIVGFAVMMILDVALG
jgi:zinc transporter, ZIP family